MGIIYPEGIDSFSEPSLPESTPLSEAGTGTRNHVEHHHDLGQAVVALEQQASWLDHDHSGSDPNNVTTAFGKKLSQANTHQNADTDSSASSIHHTLAAKDAAEVLPSAAVPTNGWKAAVYNHTHDYNGFSILNKPYFICTSQSRPGTPANPQPPTLGTMIYETDSNVVRVYTKLHPSGSGMVSASATSFYQNAPKWQILPVANVPTLHAESRMVQEMVPLYPNNFKLTHVLSDFIYSAFGVQRFMEVTTNETNPGVIGYWNLSGQYAWTTTPQGGTAINIPEPGIYDVQATIHWHPDRTYHDQSMVAVLVNNYDIGKENWEFTRGPTLPWGVQSLPGFAQTNKLAFSWRFKAGDVLRVVVRHNASRSSFLWFNNGSQDANYVQTCSVEVKFRAP